MLRNLLLLTAASLLATAEPGYRQPPKEVLDVLNAPRTPIVTLSPDRQTMLLAEPSGSPTIADLSRPMLRLAGYRIDPASNGPHLTMYTVGLSLQRLTGSTRIKLGLPPGARITTMRWSADSRWIAFANATGAGTELWIAEAATGKVRKLPVAVNGVTGDAFEWLPDQKSLLVKIVPAGRGSLPVAESAAVAPVIQESAGGKAAPVRTNQDMLRNPHDERVFDYYAISQLARVDAVTGAVKTMGAPGLILTVEASPDGGFVLVNRAKRPYSYLLPAYAFPRDVEVWSLATGAMTHRVADLPLADRIPIDGVQTGPRSVRWIPGEKGLLMWTEAMDGGNPKEKVPHRDRLMVYDVPAKTPAREVGKVEHRLTQASFGEGGLVMLTESDRVRKWVRTYALDWKKATEPKLMFSRNQQDRYRNPGTPVTRVTDSGDRVIQSAGGIVYLAGDGSSPKGDRPFLDRLDMATGKTTRLFQSAEDKYEEFVALLSDDASRILIRRESQTEPPNYFIRDAAGKLTAVTDFKDPSPQLRAIHRERVSYTRPDGVPLHFTLYLPPGYQKGQRLPAVMWAYPREYTDAETAGQVSGSLNRFSRLMGASHMYFLLRGYAILDDATMPVVGTPEQANDTYLEQVVASAKAAIDKADEMGVVDRNRVGVGGHSYGAFMTANLLAHSDLFRAGIARSGAYNRTLTPFGFQSERRTFWEAPEIYLKMSPFLSAHKIKEPILFIHGEADNNQGTFPIQSERMYAAVRGNGGPARLVMLPHESHGYAAKESIEHTLAEMIDWFDKHVKNAGRLPDSSQ